MIYLSFKKLLTKEWLEHQNGPKDQKGDHMKMTWKKEWSFVTYWVYSWVYLGILNFLLLNSSIEKSYLLNLSNNTELLTPGVIWNREEYFIENAMFDTNQCLVHKSH